MDQAIYQTLFAEAARARQNSHSPISNFKVGAAFRTATGSIYAGTNAEDPAFNHTLHGEQSAIGTMVSKEGRQKITELVVVGGEPGDGTVCTPCGHCRQLLVEFADDDLPITVAGPEGDVRLETTLGTLLPHAFRLSNFESGLHR